MNMNKSVALFVSRIAYRVSCEENKRQKPGVRIQKTERNSDKTYMTSSQFL